MKLSKKKNSKKQKTQNAKRKINKIKNTRRKNRSDRNRSDRKCSDRKCSDRNRSGRGGNGNANIEVDLENVKKKVCLPFTNNVSYNIFRSIVSKFMDKADFRNRSGEYTLGDYFQRYINDNSLDYMPISNFITDINKELNEFANTNIVYINPDFFKVNNQIEFLRYTCEYINYLTSLHNEEYVIENLTEIMIFSLNICEMINESIYELLYEGNNEFGNNILNLESIDTENSNMHNYLINRIIEILPLNEFGMNIDMYMDTDTNNNVNMFNIKIEDITESCDDYKEYDFMLAKKNAYYKHQLKHNVPYIPEDLQKYIRESYL